MSALGCIGASLSERLNESPLSGLRIGLRFADFAALEARPVSFFLFLVFGVSRLSPLWGRGRCRLFWRHAASTALGRDRFRLFWLMFLAPCFCLPPLERCSFRGRAFARTPNGNQVGGRAAGQMASKNNSHWTYVKGFSVSMATQNRKKNARKP